VAVSLRNRINLSLFPLILLFSGITLYLFTNLADLSEASEYQLSEEQFITEQLTDIRQYLKTLNILLDDDLFVNLPDGQQRIRTLGADIEENRKELQNSLVQIRLQKLGELSRAFDEQLVSVVSKGQSFEASGTDSLSFRENTGAALQATEEVSRVLHSLYREERLTYQRNILLTRTIFTGFMFLMIGSTLLLSFFLWRRIAQPIEKIISHMDSFDRSGLPRQTGIKSKDELGRLAKTFERMMDRLANYRELSDEKVLRSTSAFRTVLENSRDAFFVLTPDFRPLYCNPRAESIKNQTNFLEDPPEQVSDVFHRTFESGKPAFEDHLRSALKIRLGDEERWFLLDCFPIEALPYSEVSAGQESNGSAWIAVVLKDVTLLKLSESLRKNLVATVSHELKTPVTSARISMYLLLEKQIGPLNEGQEDLVVTARDDLNRQLAMIQNLLDLSHVEEKATNPDYHEFDFVQMLKECSATHKEIAEGMSLSLQIEAPEPPVLVDADRSKLGVVLNSMLVNVIKRCGHGDSLFVRLQEFDNRVRVSVTACDPGTTKEDLDKHLSEEEDFSERIDHTDIGIRISRSIVEAHGGRLARFGKRGGPSTLFFEIPGKRNRSS